MLSQGLKDQIIIKLQAKQVDAIVVHPLIEFDGEIRFIDDRACMLFTSANLAVICADLEAHCISPIGIGDFVLGIPVIRNMPEDKITKAPVKPVAVKRGTL